VRVPELLLLDEPSVGVDPLSRRDLWQILEQLIGDEGLSVIVSTAYMDEAERCDEIFVLNKGRLLAQGTAEHLRRKAEGLTYIATPTAGMLARNLQARLIDARDRIVDAVPRGGAVRLIRDSGHELSTISELLEGAHVEPRPAELEDAFMFLLRQHETPGEAHKPPPLTEATSDAAPVPLGQDKGTEREVMIRVRDLVRRFGDFTAVANTSFDVGKGEIFGLLGPNGAGKTTTFRMLCGLLPATSGQLDVAGVNLRTARAAARVRIGYVAQKFSLYSNLSVRENLEFFGGAYGLRGKMLRRRVRETLERFNLDASATCGLLPLGYKQRLAMATGLIHEPDILFLDEPTSGIDPLARRAFWRTITALADEGVTIIVTTHFMEEAEYCDRIAIQDAGHLLALGTPREVREQAGNGEADDMDRAFIAIVEQARARASSEQAAA
jgi:ABC-2 type transport system ATP-binding protein